MTESNDNNSMAQHHQQQQLFLMQQQQLHLQQQQQLKRQKQRQQQSQPSAQHQSPYSLLQQQQQQQQQQAISRFPSNIDAHLRAPGLRSLHFQGPAALPPASQPPSAANLHHPPPQSQPVRPSGVGVGIGRPGNPLEVEMAQKDAMMVCNPDFKRPFASVDDAILRLLPYHVVSDYEAEEDDRILDNDTTGQYFSQIQQWDHNILAKIAEFTTTFEKQVLAFDIMTRKRAQGEFRSEERLMIEQALLQEEKQALVGIRVREELESREKVGREAAEAKVRLVTAQAEHSRAEAQAHAEMYARAPMRVGAAAITEAGPGLHIVPEQGGNMEDIHQWGNSQREDEEPPEDFLNDENEPENGDTGTQGEWRGSGKLDLNSR